MGDPEPASTAFILICTALVQLMTPGLAFFYGGLVKDTSATRKPKASRETERGAHDDDAMLHLPGSVEHLLAAAS